jgi:predicted NAD/FAD-binding protein
LRYLIPPPSAGNRRKRIAVIGSGISGLSAAWLLAQRHDVVLYEKDGWVGGHAHTVDAATAAGSIPVDTGFIVYNERNYPNLTALFDHLGVRTEASEMSFAASVDDGAFEYSSAGLNRYFGQRRNLLRPRFWRMTADLLRFYRTASALPTDAAFGDMTLGDYLDRKGYSRTFTEDHILPMSAAIWSTTPDEIRAYPLAAFVRFFASHSLFSLRTRPEWRTVTGGSREYTRRLAAGLTDLRVGIGARRIERTPSGVVVEDERGGIDRFSDIVIATHADQAIELLADPDPQERQILGAFKYTDNDVVLHSDASLMPRERRVWSSWNFIGDSTGGEGRQLSVTYWMNRLQNLDRRAPLFVTLNATREPAADRVIARYSCSHPYFDRTALAAQNELWRLQGQRHTWFCGAYFGYGFHEDGLQAGLAVAEALGGVRRPWSSADERIAPAVPQAQPELAA